MKKIILNLLIILTSGMLFFSCKPDEPESSKPTFYPVIKLKGSKYVSIPLGESFIDEGVSATVNGIEIEYSVDGEVDNTKTGLYVLNYIAVNEDGFEGSETRYVMVIPEAEKPDAINLEGQWETNNAPSAEYQFAQITKLAPGFYFTTNCWGSGSRAIIPAYFFTVDGKTLEIPYQKSGNLIQTVEPGSCVDGKISWQIVRLDFPGGALTANKFWTKL